MALVPKEIADRITALEEASAVMEEKLALVEEALAPAEEKEDDDSNIG